MKTRLLRKGVLGGGLGILMALVLVASSGTPALAVPAPPHQFYGSVIVDGQQAEAGTAVTATINGVQYDYCTTTVDADGHYGYSPSFKLPSDDPQTPQKEGGVDGDLVEFYVLDTLAGEAQFAIFGVDRLDLQVTTSTSAAPPPPAQQSLTVGSMAGGSVTDPGEGVFTCDSGEVVNLLAVPQAGFGFVSWTGDVGTVANVYAADTTITTDGDYTITATFALKACYLTVASTAGGSVTSPGEGVFSRVSGSVVNLQAVPEPGCEFVNWTGDVGTVANVNAASTAITMNGSHAIIANFTSAGCSLTVASAAGGSVTDPGEGVFAHGCGDVVNLLAVPEAGFGFVNWTGDVGTVANVYAPGTTITVNGDCTVTANFALMGCRLTVGSTAGGSVTGPGEGAFIRVPGTVVNLQAVPEPGYEFVSWTGEVSTVANVGAAGTTIAMNSDHTITANFALTGNTMPSLSGHKLIALLLVPESESIEDLLANINASLSTCDGGIQTWYIYVPGDPAQGDGYWVEVTSPCTE